MCGRLALAAALLAAGCARRNPAFGEERTAGGASESGGETSTSTTSSSTRGSTLDTLSDSDDTASPTQTTMDPESSEVGPMSTGQSSDSSVDRTWWDNAYAYRLPLTFVPREAPLPGFVTLVPLTIDPRLLADVTESQLVFVDVATNLRIPAEISTFNPDEGKVTAWVQLPLWQSVETTDVDLYFGATAPPSAARSPWGGHIGVWHMDTIAGGVTPDAAGTAHATQVAGAGSADPPTSTAGIASAALAFDGETSRLEAVLTETPEDDTFLVSAWVYAESYAEEGSPIIARGPRPGPTWADFEWVMGFTSSRSEIRLHDDSQLGSPTPNAGVVLRPTGEWHHYASLYTGSNIRLYVDGVSQVSGSAAGGLDHIFDVVSIGGYADPIAPGWETMLLDGRIDELRWRRGAGADASNDVWVETLIESQTVPLETFEPSPVESL